MNPKWRDYLLGILLLITGIVLFTAATIVWGKAPVFVQATRSAKTTGVATVSSREASGTQHSAIPALTSTQKQVLVEAYQAGYHVGLPLVFAAVVYVETRGNCRRGDHGLAYGCSQIHRVAAVAATGMQIPMWVLADPATQDVNMAIGARYLSECIQRWGFPAGIGVYNTGPTIGAELGRARLAMLPYTLAVLRAMAWMRHLPLSVD